MAWSGWLATTHGLCVVETRIRVYTLPRWLVNIATCTDLPWHTIFNFQSLTSPRSHTLFPSPLCSHILAHREAKSCCCARAGLSLAHAPHRLASVASLRCSAA
ncbi:hypothetical protein PsYK624_054320 [Phanerochaete sordida]|uniref:Uncharacterized protein n=1 Tax=Phanerochaete sordida TaxID=48140 RepID=A0A9P3G6S6_9APHY|nr:hypothetical protein PsYK624_054320 [Phanerochaete sordida]